MFGVVSIVTVDGHKAGLYARQLVLIASNLQMRNQTAVSLEFLDAKHSQITR